MSEKAPSLSAAQKEKKVYKAAVVETTQLAEDQARDVAEHRMTESKEDRTGNWFKRTATRVWKHNLFQEFYRQKEIQSARREIRETGNIYAGEHEGDTARHEEAMAAVVDRFTSEYDQEMLKDDERESRKEIDPEINAHIKKLVREYATNPDMEKDAFIEERNRILAQADPKYGKEGKLYADNLFTIANEVRASFTHAGKLADEDFDIELTLGKARSSLNTEAQLHTFDKITEKLQTSKVGRFLVNEPAALAIGAAAYGAAQAIGLSALRSNVAKVFTFGAGAVVAGGISGLKESVRLERERSQHMRERAKGSDFEKDAKRREEMEKNRYETKNATTIISNLEQGLTRISGTEASKEDIDEVMKELADLESRVQAGDRKKADLITYSRFDQVEQERTKLDLLRAKLKVALRKSPHVSNFDQTLGDLSNSHRIALEFGTEDTEGMRKKDEVFKKMKHAKVAKAVISTVLVGAAAGFAFQEVAASVDSHKDGLFEGIFKNFGKHHGTATHPEAVTGLEKEATVLEGLRRYIAGNSPRMPFGHGHEMLVGNTHIQLPDGVDMHANPDGTYTILRDGSAVGKPVTLAFDTHGDLTNASRVALAKEDVYGDFSHVTGHESSGFQEKSEDYIKHTAGTTRVHRELWYDNNTPKPVFDHNELKEWWGGTNNSGVDAQGNYVFNIHHMMPKGSFHAGQSVDATKTSGLKMLFSLSKSTQHQVFEASVNPDGTVSIPKDSELAKLMFTTEHGHAVFQGQFAEVSQSMGNAADGGENVRILSTVVGHGRNMIDQNQLLPKEIPSVRLDVPDQSDWELPPFIPIPLARQPLERALTPNSKDKLVTPVEFGYHYFGFLSKETEHEYDKQLSKELRGNPDAQLDSKTQVREYLAREESSSFEQIKELAAQAGPMSPDCKLSICIPVAGHQEANNIERTLAAYLNQTADKDAYEIVLFINQPQTDKAGNPITPDGTAEKVQKFKDQHPELNIRVMNKTLSVEQARIGNIRKLLNDATLLRSNERTNTSDLIIVSNDADTRGVAPEYIKNFIELFESNSNVDGAMGQLDWDPESYIRNPLIHIGTRLFQYLDIQERKKQGHVGSSGANFAFRSSIYAATGGYNPDTSLAEDVELGRKIKHARKGANEHATPVVFAGARVSRLYTSSRRAENAMKAGLSPVEQWVPTFSAFDDEVRKTNWEEGAIALNYDDPAVIQKLIPEIQTVINRTLKATYGWMNKREFKNYVRRSLGWLGVKYTLTGENQIEITDASRLIEGLKQYQKEGMDIMNRKLGNPAPSNTQEA